jgi:hypothetical protein
MLMREVLTADGGPWFGHEKLLVAWGSTFTTAT